MSAGGIITRILKRDIMEEIQIPDSLKRSPNWDNIST